MTYAVNQLLTDVVYLSRWFKYSGSLLSAWQLLYEYSFSVFQRAAYQEGGKEQIQLDCDHDTGCACQLGKLCFHPK